MIRSEHTSEHPCGRDAATVLVEHVREAIRAGRFPTDRFLPTVRELGEKFKASPETVRRGLKKLELEGLLVAQARHGFRVIRPPSREVVAGPVAYVTDYDEEMSKAQAANWALIEALQTAGAQRGTGVLMTPCEGQGQSAVLDRLRSGRASGIVLDTLNPLLADAIRDSGVPVVMVNSWWEDTKFDVVLQDNYRGGFLAAKHLLESGCRRVAWLGPVGQSCHSRERYAGAVAAMAMAGRGLIVPTGGDLQPEALHRMAIEMLESSERPEGFLSFSTAGMAALRDASALRGMRLGTDIRIVGWMVEEFHAREYKVLFNGGPIPPAVVWKASTMAERALALLAERRSGGGGEPVRVCVPTRLKLES